MEDVNQYHDRIHKYGGEPIKKGDDGYAEFLSRKVALAEKLLDIQPWAKMARFAKTGGEINAIAIRIARAFSKKDIVAFCGYHGWPDWYLAANLNNKKSLLIKKMTLKR